ncbi:MAG TPA: hypothetical protein VK979_09560 [Guyparkeria sp.]|nr:hypothetical protein [Guyparkeria sp.]
MKSNLKFYSVGAAVMGVMLLIMQSIALSAQANAISHQKRVIDDMAQLVADHMAEHMTAEAEAEPEVTDE